MSVRTLLGNRLKVLREAADLTVEQAAAAAGLDPLRLDLAEAGGESLDLRTLQALCVLYGLDQAGCALLLTVARQARLPAWWEGYGDVLPAAYGRLLDAEQSAKALRISQPFGVPHLLQTAAYARAEITLTAPGPAVDRLVELRMRRQQILHAGHRPTHLWAVIEETALLRPYGGPSVMGGQLRHLAEMAALPNVTLQILPCRTAGVLQAAGALILARPADPLPDVVCLDEHGHPSYPDDVPRYRALFERHAHAALPPAHTPNILARIGDDLRKVP